MTRKRRESSFLLIKKKNSKKLNIFTTLLHLRTLRKITEKRLRHKFLQLTDSLRGREMAAKTLRGLLHCPIHLRSQKISVRETESLEFWFGSRPIRPRNITYALLRNRGKPKTRYRAILRPATSRRETPAPPASLELGQSLPKLTLRPEERCRSVRFHCRWASGRLRFVQLPDSIC